MRVSREANRRAVRLQRESLHGLHRASKVAGYLSSNDGRNSIRLPVGQERSFHFSACDPSRVRTLAQCWPCIGHLDVERGYRSNDLLICHPPCLFAQAISRILIRSWPHRSGAMVQRLARSPFKAKIRVRFPLALPTEFEIFSVLHGWQLTSCNFGPSSAASSLMASLLTPFFKEPI